MKKLRRDTIAEDDYTILDFGWDDRLEGKRKSDNPYAISNWKHYEWEKGAQTSEKVPNLQAPRREDGGLTPVCCSQFRASRGANFRWTRTPGGYYVY